MQVHLPTHATWYVNAYRFIVLLLFLSLITIFSDVPAQHASAAPAPIAPSPALRARARVYFERGRPRRNAARDSRGGKWRSIVRTRNRETTDEFFLEHKPPQIFPKLTGHERETLQLIAQGYNNAEIADKLFLAPKTVRNHISNIFSKLQVADRAQAIAKARNAGWG